MLEAAHLGGGTMRDQFDVSLEDTELLSEVELMTSLMIAATESVEPLSPEEIDEVLGVERRPALTDPYGVGHARGRLDVAS